MFFLKNIKTMTDWIDIGCPVTRFMDSIEFNNFFYIFILNYIIKIDAHKIKREPKSRYLFETIIPIESK
jgi:galactitol-specific phosphotransferase system IIB component